MRSPTSGLNLVPLLDELRLNGRAEILPAYRRVTPAVCAMSEKWAVLGSNQ